VLVHLAGRSRLVVLPRWMMESGDSAFDLLVIERYGDFTTIVRSRVTC
jgi:hypothetical protein